ncbi:MAG: peptide ABC transporter permease [Geminicoccaceae bacterium]|nr:MAG: peptide ABC transporter permease [Geminicoccaceae bacterium]
MSPALARFARDRAALVAAFLLLGLALAAAAAPLLWPVDPDAVGGPPLLRPFLDPAHPLGTDRLGRDVLARLLHGARLSLTVAVAAAAASSVLGAAVGLAAGLVGGRIDDLLMRITDAFQTVPGFLLALAFVSVFGPDARSVVLAIAASAWTGPARLIRAEIVALRGRDFVLAAIVAGLPRRDVALRVLLPNALPPVVAYAAVSVASAVLIEAALSFLGLADPNRASWGAMIAEGRAVLVSEPWLSILPGLALLSTVLAVNLVGEGLNEALAPRRARP